MHNHNMNTMLLRNVRQGIMFSIHDTKCANVLLNNTVNFKSLNSEKEIPIQWTRSRPLFQFCTLPIHFKVVLNNSCLLVLQPIGSILAFSLKKCNQRPTEISTYTSSPFLLTFLKNAAGAISAPFRVLKRNIGQEDAFIWNPK